MQLYDTLADKNLKEKSDNSIKMVFNSSDILFRLKTDRADSCKENDYFICFVM